MNLKILKKLGINHKDEDFRDSRLITETCRKNQTVLCAVTLSLKAPLFHTLTSRGMRIRKEEAAL